MNKSTLYLYRHGNTFNPEDKVIQVGKKTDLALTTQGIEQAHNFAKHLKQHNIDLSHIYSGSLKRQTKSLSTIASYYPNAITNINTPALDEIDYGLWEGLSINEIQQEWPSQANKWQTQATWQTGIFGGSLADHLNNLNSFFDNLRANQQPNQAQLIISSNGIIRYFLKFTAKWQDLVTTKSLEELKVKTGNFCKLHLRPSDKSKCTENNQFDIELWNIKP